MTEDLKKLESLSYEPKKHINSIWCKCSACLEQDMIEMGFNSHVIKPGMRVNKAEGAEEQLIDNYMGEEPSSLEKCTECGESWKTHNLSCKPIKTGVAILECPTCKERRSCGVGEKCPECQPNQNIMIIKEIEGLISQVNEKLIKLSDELSIPDRAYILMALEEIDLFQKTTLFGLRKSFE